LELQEKLTSQIENPLDLSPTPLSELGGDVIQPSEFMDKIIKGNVTAKDFKSAAKGLAVGGAIVGGALAITALSPILLTEGVTASMSSSLGGSMFTMKNALIALAAFTGGKKIFDFRGKELGTFRKKISGVPKKARLIEMGVQNGVPATDSLELLNDMAEGVDFAESEIKRLGIYNVDYRASKKYINDMGAIQSARIAIRNRVMGIENIAITGKAKYNAENLIFLASQFDEGEYIDEDLYSAEELE
jgi:hypothetical protein